MSVSQKAIEKEGSIDGQVKVPLYMGVKEFCKKYPFIKETTLRWQIHTRDSLGIAEVFIRPFGQRMVLIDVERYFLLMKELGR
ncbi:MAG: hypothetical protein COT84_03980 [Chlamydiae bacterium CG10_big_fil_rev_8_21_14_0_10_35_9]|nr:MAG: hypothetical protein COT84_03980 [Chlamydiae bacterium CG10_big_fil_rev_8_21_14_0_10_35_9]